jgi:hypothetical protein
MDHSFKPNRQLAQGLWSARGERLKETARQLYAHGQSGSCGPPAAVVRPRPEGECKIGAPQGSAERRWTADADERLTSDQFVAKQ